MGTTTTRQTVMVPGRNDTMPAHPITLNASVPTFMRMSDVVEGVGARLRMVHLQLVAGVRMRDLTPNGVWTGVNADMELGGGSARSGAAQISPPKTEMTSPRSTAVVTTNATGDTVTRRLYLPAAHRAIVAGDATDWKPVAMARQPEGLWSVALPVAGPVSRLHVRSDDGEWGAIPGLPATHDPYGGLGSLLVVLRPSP